VQLLVNNAGAFAHSPLAETEAKDWEWLLSINVKGVVNGLHTFLPRLRAQGKGGHIVNTASISGHLPMAGLSIYTATKYAVVGLSECLNLELSEEDIGVSILCPGIVKTGLIESSALLRPDVHGGPLAPESNPLRAVIEQGTDPADVGERVVDGIRNGELYIFVHADLAMAVKYRHGEIQAAYERQC
jgi:short-subunit dehydrogenase